MGLVEAEAHDESKSKPGLGDRERSSLFGHLVGVLRSFVQGFVPKACEENPEALRRARLITRFAFLGVVSGALYASFFMLVEHYYGVAIIMACTMFFAIVPYLLKRSQNLDLSGNILSGVMVAGFTGLGGVEGGMHGHALAWLASVPLCALLLVGKQAAKVWVIVSFMASAGMIAMGLMDVALPKTYPPEWDGLITALGYLGLIPFMFLLGMSFETSREAAFGKMQEALKKVEASNVELLRLSEEKTEFMGIAAHDLKNPLTVIIGNAEMIGRARNPGMVAQLVDNIRISGTRMYDLIKNLLDANAIEEGKFRLNLERHNLCTMLERSLEDNYFSATRKGIQILVTKPDELWVRADADAMQQILDNLISNAVKYSVPNTLVEVRVGLNGKGAMVAIKDEGPGLSEEDQAKLFQKFSRLTPKPTGGESSNGLGLSIVKKLTEAMDGTVECRSVLGAGTTFTVKLPLWEEKSLEPEKGAEKVA